MISNIQYECRPHKIIVQWQIGQEIALFFKLKHLSVLLKKSPNMPFLLDYNSIITHIQNRQTFF